MGKIFYEREDGSVRVYHTKEGFEEAFNIAMTRFDRSISYYNVANGTIATRLIKTFEEYVPGMSLEVLTLFYLSKGLTGVAVRFIEKG